MKFKKDTPGQIWMLVIILVFLFSLFLIYPTANAQTPIDFKKWQIDDTTYSKQIGGSVRNYQKPNKTWAQIVNTFQIEGDSVFYVNSSVLKSRINKNGVSKVTLDWQGNEYTVTQKLLGIGWLKISTRQSLWIDSTMDWSNISMDSNIVKWTNISPAVDYRVLKDNGRVAHGIFYKPAFLDSAVILYNQRADSLDIALANVMVYTLSSNIDNADSAMGDLSKRKLKDFGYYSFNLGDQRLRFPGSDTLPQIPVRQYWERRGTKIICIEYVMMRRVKQVHEVYPMATIWHNDTKTIDGTTNIEDAHIRSGGAAQNNYGGMTQIAVDNDKIYRGLIRVKNVATELGVDATISVCVCSLYCYGGANSADVSVYRVFKPWNEGTLVGSDPADAAEGEGVVTWDDWSNDDEEWTTAGCESTDDGGSDNSGDGTGADRKATAEDTETISSTGAWYAWNISSALAQGWYDETINEEGIILLTSTTVQQSFYSTEFGSNQPFWFFTYTTDGEPEPAANFRRRKIILSQ